MKKFLALVLALVMTMSLVTISAGAEDFTDADKVTYAEAVDVMTAAGVVGGYADGSFNPTAGLTRGAAAKIICNMLLGPTTAEALTANEAPFSDVAVDNVFAGYIAYCVNEGIISGYADGTFKPAAPLTGYAFMKMLLGALGYDADIEGYVGSNWSIQVAKRALNIGLDDGLVGSFVGSKALTREEACLYAFNALNTCMVKYNNKSVISVGDITITQNTEATKVTDDGIGGDATTNHLFREEYFTKLVAGTANDEVFGRPSTSWKYDGKKVGTYAKAPILTYTDEVKEKDLFVDLGVDGYTGASSKYVLITKATEDGVGAFTASYNATTEAYTVTAGAWDATNSNNSAVIAKGDKSVIAGTGVGTTTEVYETTKDNEFVVVFVNEFIGKVTSITKANDAKDEGRKINMTVAGLSGTKSFETDEFAKGDYVLVTAAAGTVKSVEAVEVLENVAVTAYTTSKVTIDGVEYKYSNRADTIADKGAYNMSAGNTYTFYLDSNGNVIKGEVYTASNSDYYRVVAKSAEKTDSFGQNAYHIYKVVDAQGAVSEVKMMVATGTVSSPSWVTMAADDDNDGYMKLTGLSSYNTAAPETAGVKAGTAITEFVKTAATVGGIAVNNNTVFVLKVDTNKYESVTGLKNMDSYDSISTTPVAVMKDDVAVVVYMDVSAGTTSTTTDDLVYVVSASATTSYDATNKCTVYTYKAIVDGELTTIATKIAPASMSIGLKKITSTSDGYVSTLSNITTTGVYVVQATTGADKVTFEGGVVIVDGTAYVVAEDVMVYTVDADDAFVADAGIDAVTGDAVNGTFYLIKESTSDATIATIYFDGTVA